MKLRNSNYRLDGLIGYEHRETLTRLSECTGIKSESIISLALQNFFALPDETKFKLLSEYHQHSAPFIHKLITVKTGI